jgi:hypothetical protein
LDITQATETKISKWDYINLKCFCKRNNQQNENTPIEKEKIFANHTSDKGLISKIYKELL